MLRINRAQRPRNSGANWAQRALPASGPAIPFGGLIERKTMRNRAQMKRKTLKDEAQVKRKVLENETEMKRKLDKNEAQMKRKFRDLFISKFLRARTLSLVLRPALAAIRVRQDY